MQVDPVYSAWHYSHPPLVDRLFAIDGRGKGAKPTTTTAGKEKTT